MPFAVPRLIAVSAAVLGLAACTSASPMRSTSRPIVATSSPAPVATGSGSAAAASSVPAESPAALPASTTAATPTPSPSSAAPHPPLAKVTRPTAPKSSKPASADRLPLTFSTGDADQVITVVGTSTRGTTATLQAWQRSGSGWKRVGPSVLAHLGTDGMTTHPSESLSATPIGSFTLTQAFGHDSNPGTALPYLHTTPSDWWISQAGPLYNTVQSCSAKCAFTQGDPNEHLYYETPFYDYAVVIDYNRAPVVQGAGSAFFLHVTNGAPTAGCVSIDPTDLVRIMRWLRPADHPRILIGL